MKLQEFCAEIRTRTCAVQASHGSEMQQLHAELSAFIADKVPALIAEGLTVQEIQDAMRLAVDDLVPQTYAPDDEQSSDEQGKGEEDLTPPISEITFFVPLNEKVVTAFSAGALEPGALLAHITTEPALEAFDELAGLEYVLTEFGETPEFEEAISGGEIVVGPDGEAFMPEYLTVTDAEFDGGGCHICEPMVFKTAQEVAALTKRLMDIDEKTFHKKADIKKLIKCGWLANYDKRSVKRNADFIVNELLAQFLRLRTVYLKAAGQGKGLALFVGYEGEDE